MDNLKYIIDDEIEKMIKKQKFIRINEVVE
jgi:hypothetical protein